MNQNGIYDPSNGDYPVEPKDLLVADQLTWTVSNTIAGGEATAEGTEIFPLEIQQIVWSYMPTYRPESVRDGLIQTMSDMQGESRTFHTGASFSHEAVSTISTFNQRLIERVMA